MTEKTRIVINPVAYAKVIHHACQYPSQPICGILTTLKKPQLHTKKSDLEPVHVDNAFPLFHTGPVSGLISLFEMAMIQIQNKDRWVCGYYFANENLESDEVDEIHVSIANKIRDHFGEGSFLWQVDNERIHSSQKNIQIKQYGRNGKLWCVEWDGSDEELFYDAKAFGWKFERDGKEYSEKEIVQWTMGSVTKEPFYFRQLVDFEHHVDNIKKDWRNLTYERGILSSI